jgi:uracil-DNA glycosylase
LINPILKVWLVLSHQHMKITNVFQKKEDIFAAFNFCSFKDLKVVIIGQDPYHGENQANGLCFSVKEGLKHPQSLVNIFKEVATDLNQESPQSGSL